MSQMLDESREAPQRVREFLEGDQGLYADLGERLRRLNPQVVATIARGSSDHVASYATYLIPQCTGRVVASIPPSTVTVLNSPLALKNQFALAISQSGTSPDILAAFTRARQSGALTASLVNDSTSPLGKAAEVLLPQRAQVEKSLAATKTVLCSMTAVARLVGEWAKDEKLLASLRVLPAVLDQAVAIGNRIDATLFEGVTDVFVISRAQGLSAAQEVALKIKETCGLHSEAFSSAEVRHGPREIVDEHFLVIALALPGSSEKDVIEVALELKAQGAKVLIVAPPELKREGIPFAELPAGADSRLMPIVCLQLLYPWLARSSETLGRDPDRPKYLKSKVVNTL